jgi:hypothetical protein
VNGAVVGQRNMFQVTYLILALNAFKVARVDAIYLFIILVGFGNSDQKIILI